MARVAHGQALGASTRRTVVTTAMTNMNASSSSDSPNDLMTAAMTSAAMLSCTIARAAANRVEPGCGSRPTRYIVTVRASSSTTARATGRPGSIVTRTPYAVRRVSSARREVRCPPSRRHGIRGFRRSRPPLADWVAASRRLDGPRHGGSAQDPGPDQHAARRTHLRTQQHQTPAGDLWQAARKRHPSCSVSTSSTRASIKTDIPAFRAGDNVKVHVKVVEGTRSRIQVFQGVVIRRHGGGVGETFTVRKVSFGVGVERTFPLHTPIIDHIELVTRGDVRRAKLYYLRDLRGKAAKIKEKRDTPVAR